MVVASSLFAVVCLWTKLFLGALFYAIRAISFRVLARVFEFVYIFEFVLT